MFYRAPIKTKRIKTNNEVIESVFHTSTAADIRHMTKYKHAVISTSSYTKCVIKAVFSTSVESDYFHIVYGTAEY